MRVRNEYEVNEKANSHDYLKAGFTERGTYFWMKHYLHDEDIYLTIKINKEDNFLTQHVLAIDGSEYLAFWNNEWGVNNIFADVCIEEYNRFMDSLVDAGIFNPKEDAAILPDGSVSIKIKYANPRLHKLEYIDGKSDWIDLRSAEDVKMKAGEYRLISLGVAMQLPPGYEALVVPRSSTFKNFGIIQTNHMGVIDNSYCGDEDYWRFPAYALRDTEIHFNDRICQFRIIKNQPPIKFKQCTTLGNKNRGGIGSTGRN